MKTDEERAEFGVVLDWRVEAVTGGVVQERGGWDRIDTGEPVCGVKVDWKDEVTTDGVFAAQ